MTTWNSQIHEWVTFPSWGFVGDEPVQEAPFISPPWEEDSPMSNLKRWREIGQGQFQKWTEKGQALEGRYRGVKPGRFGDLGIVETDQGTMTFPIHTALATKLGAVKLGAEVRIEYLGKVTNKDGSREYKDFFVGVASDADLKTPEDDGEDVPF